MYNGNSVYKKRCYKNRQNAVFSTLNSCFTIQLFATIDNYFIQFSHALFSINLCVIYYAVHVKSVIFYSDVIILQISESALSFASLPALCEIN